MRKYPKDGCIVLQPLTIKWADWRAIGRPALSKPYSSQSILREVSTWLVRVDAWVNALTEQQKHDLMQLGMAEIDMLYCAVDAPKDSPYAEDERLDFRTRFYDLQLLVNSFTRLGVINAEHVLSMFRGLEDYATERKGWLP